jgi:Fic family protein
MLARVAAIAERVGGWRSTADANLRLRRINRVRTIQGSLAIEGNSLTEAQITAVLEGKRVLAPPREILEVRNALASYDRLEAWEPGSEADLLDTHATLMRDLIPEAGRYRRSGVGVMAGATVIHMAPPAHRVAALMEQLFGWLNTTPAHPLITSCVFHYELEFIHPFSDGNGRLGRLCAPPPPKSPPKSPLRSPLKSPRSCAHSGNRCHAAPCKWRSPSATPPPSATATSAPHSPSASST